MASVIGSLEIQLLANIARLQSDMTKATRTVDSAMGSISKSVAGAQKLLLGLGVGVSFGALIGQVNKAIETLGKLDDMAQKTGSSVENLSRLQKVASQFGADFGAVDVAIGKLSKGLAGIDDAGGKTAKALNAIGISQQFVKNNDPSQVLVEVAKKLQNYQDGASKAALATDLFGKAGIELLPYLNDVAENVDRFTGVSAEAAARAAKLQDDLGGLKVGFSQLVDTITIGMLPAMSAFIGKLNQVLQFKSIFSSVGGIDAKDYDKEIAKRQKSLDIVLKSKESLSKPTLSNKINDYVFGDVRDLNTQITVYKDEIKALQDLKKAQDLVNASPYKSPNSDKPKLNYAGAEAQSAMDSQRAAAASKAEAARKKANDELLKEIQQQVDFEHDQKETLYKYEDAEEAKQEKAKQELTEKFFEMDKKYLDIINNTENKMLDEQAKKKADAAEKLAKQQEELAKDINKSLTDALLRGFESGKGFAKNFVDTLKNMFQTLVLRPIISAVIDSSGLTKLVTGASGGLASLFSGNASASGGAAASGGSMFGGLGDLFSMGKSLFGGGGVQGALIGSIEKLGTIFSNGLGGLGDSIGGFLGANAGMISNVLPFAGAALQLLSGNAKGAAFTAAGAAIGSFIPIIGTALGGVIGSVIGSFFGGSKLPPRVTESRNGTFSNGKFTAFEGADVGKRKLGAASSLDSLNEAFSKQLDTLFKAFDINQTIGTNSVLTKKKSVRAGFNATVGGVNVAGYNESFGKKGEFKVALESLINNALGSVTVRAIQASNLSDGIKGLFNGFTKKEEVTSLINATISLNSAQKELSDTFGITVDQSAKAVAGIGLAGASLIQMVNKLTTAALSTRSIGDVLIGAKTGILGVIGNSLGKVTSEAVQKLIARQVEIVATVTKTSFASGTNFLGNLGKDVNGSSIAGISKAPAGNTKQYMTVYDSVTEYVDSITAINAKLPSTLKDFDALLKGINKSTATGLKQFSDLFLIRDQFIQFTQAIGGLKGNVRGALFGIVSDAEKQQMLNADLAKLFGDLGRDVPGSIDELIALGKSIDYTTAEGLNLAAVFPSLVQAFNQTQSAVESLMNTLRDESVFNTLVDYQRYTGVANNYGTSFANKYVDNLPSFATGTNMLPSDMVANVHSGERIVPAADNRAMIQALNGDSEVKQLLRDLITEVRAGNIPMIQAVQKTAKVMQRIDDEGVIINETNNAGVRTVLNTRVVA